MVYDQMISMSSVDLILQNIKSSCHIKDVATGRYVDSNLVNLKKFKFTKVSDIIGATMWDLNNFMEKFWGSDLARDIDMMEQNVVSQSKEFSDIRSFLGADGKIWTHDMTKIPLISSNGKVNSILTISEDITYKNDLFSLWGLYLQHYTVVHKKRAIKKYLEHLSILACFNELPTEAELRTLIAHHKNPTTSGVASILELPIRDVEVLICRLKEKIKIEILSVVLMIKVVN